MLLSYQISFFYPREARNLCWLCNLSILQVFPCLAGAWMLRYFCWLGLLQHLLWSFFFFLNVFFGVFNIYIYIHFKWWCITHLLGLHTWRVCRSAYLKTRVNWMLLPALWNMKWTIIRRCAFGSYNLILTVSLICWRECSSQYCHDLMTCIDSAIFAIQTLCITSSSI